MKTLPENHSVITTISRTHFFLWLAILFDDFTTAQTYNCYWFCNDNGCYGSPCIWITDVRMLRRSRRRTSCYIWHWVFFWFCFFLNFLVCILSFHCNKNNKKIIDIADTNSLKCTWSKWRPTTYFILHVVDSYLTSSEQYILMTRASLHTIHHVDKRRHLWVWKLSLAKEHHRSVITSGIINFSSYCG